jgi:hypothetical protein
MGSEALSLRDERLGPQRTASCAHLRSYRSEPGKHTLRPKAKESSPARSTRRPDIHSRGDSLKAKLRYNITICIAGALMILGSVYLYQEGSTARPVVLVFAILGVAVFLWTGTELVRMAWKRNH